MSEAIPELGVVFWPVGKGDSTTIVVSDDVVVQVDLNDRAKADADDTPEVPVVDLLVESLPRDADGQPFLSAFILTHADEDHCSGFADLLQEVTIGELWATPRMWREYLQDPAGPALCKDAQAFHEEVKRRVEAVKDAVSNGNDIALGDRVLVVGYDTDESKHAYHDLPADYLLEPGQSITKINGEDHAGRFEAFIHAPFKGDCAEARNDTSLSVQVTLTDESGEDAKVLLFGDLAYETIMRIFRYSEYHDRREYLEWNLLLAPHHCSKRVMYVREDGKDVFKPDIMKAFERNARANAVVVSSSGVIPSSDKDGDLPPHRKAADRYRDYVANFICTMEWPSVADPSPVVLVVDAAGVRILQDDVVEHAVKSMQIAGGAGGTRLSEVAAAATAAGRFAKGVISVSDTAAMSGPDRVRAAIKADRGTQDPPATTVGFG